MLPENFKESLRCVELACQKIGLYFSFQVENQILAKVTLKSGKELFFMHNKNPFNDYVSAKICADKALQYELIEKTSINQPFTKIYFNPLSKTEFKEYTTLKSLKSVKEDILKSFNFPFILKKHNSSLSKSVYLVQNPQQLEELLSQYFQEDVFCILLAQTFISGLEYRVIAFDGDVLLAYTKSQKFQSSQVEPPIKVDSTELLQKFQKLSQTIFQKIPARFVGIDLFIDENGETFLLEVNSNPACFFYNKYHGREDFTQVYQLCLEKY